MSNQRKRLDAAIREWRWRLFRADFRAAWWIVGLVVITLFGLAYWLGTPRSVVGEARGVVVGSFTRQSELGRSPAELRVQLDEGFTVTSRLPMSQPYRMGAEVELHILRRDWPPRTMSYRFVRYADEK